MKKACIGVTFESPARLRIISEALSLVDAITIPLPAHDRSLDQWKELDGLLLTGGPDISPSMYGQACHPLCGPADDDRDKLEMKLLEALYKREIPILGICRGMQVINVFLGGTLNQHLAHPEWHHHRFSIGQLSAVHSVVFERDSRLRATFGADVATVNSRHHQGVGDLGKELLVSGKSSDGVVEALEHRSHFYMVGVQWHPEDRIQSSEIDKRIFDSFVDACRLR